MGIFTYECPKCLAKKMVEHKIAETPYVRCDKCVTVMNRAIRSTNQKVIYASRSKNP